MEPYRQLTLWARGCHRDDAWDAHPRRLTQSLVDPGTGRSYDRYTICPNCGKTALRERKSFWTEVTGIHTPLYAEIWQAFGVTPPHLRAPPAP